MHESLTPSEGWGVISLIRTSCHLWWPPWQTWEQAWETARSGTSWQSDLGPVAAALALQSQRVGAWERGQRHYNCLPKSSLPRRAQSPRTSMDGWGWLQNDLENVQYVRLILWRGSCAQVQKLWFPRNGSDQSIEWVRANVWILFTWKYQLFNGMSTHC